MFAMRAALRAAAVLALLLPGLAQTSDQHLQGVPVVTVSGVVVDAVTGWPVYAHVAVDTMPGTETWTDPVTGVYSIAVDAGMEHTVTATGYSSLYLPSTRTVGPFVDDGVVNVLLPQGAEACNLDWATTLLGPEGFDTPGTPLGWSVFDYQGSGQAWRFDNPGNRANMTGGTGGFAIIDSDAYGPEGQQNTWLVAPAFSLAGRTGAVLEFKSDFRAPDGNIANVDARTATGYWTNIWHRWDSERGPRTERLSLAAFSGEPWVQLRFHYYTGNWDWWWQLDDVQVIDCVPPDSGYGLVHGNVSDFNLGSDLAGATLESGTGSTVSQVTADPGQGDGFYVLYLPAGLQTITATRPPYTPVEVQVSVASGSAVRADILLGGGWLEPFPRSIHATARAGTATVVRGQLGNTGLEDLVWQVLEVAGPPQAGDYPRSAEFRVVAGEVPWLSTATSAGALAPGEYAPFDVLLDASALPSGTYQAQLVFETDTPYPEWVVGVTFEVSKPAPLLRDGFES